MFIRPMKTFIVFFCLLIAAGCSGAVIHKINRSKNFAPGSVSRVAVLNFNKGEIRGIGTEIIVDKFTAALVDAESFKLVDRADIQKIYKEVAFQNAGTGMIDEKTRQELKQLGADSVLTGTLHAYSENRRPDGFVLASEVHLTAKLLKIETGEVLWSAEILKNSRAKNVGKKKMIGGEAEALGGSKLLDEIICDMADSLSPRRSMIDRIKDLKK